MKKLILFILPLLLNYSCNTKPKRKLPKRNYTNTIKKLNSNEIIETVKINGVEMSGADVNFEFENGKIYEISAVGYDTVTIEFIQVDKLDGLNIFLSEEKKDSTGDIIHDNYKEGDTTFHIGKIVYCTDVEKKEIPYIHIQHRRNVIVGDKDIIKKLEPTECEFSGKINERLTSYTIEYDWEDDFDTFGDTSRVVIKYYDIIDDSSEVEIVLLDDIPFHNFKQIASTCYCK